MADRDRWNPQATHLKAYRTTASLLKKGLFPDVLGTKRGLNSKLHAVCDGNGRLLVMLLSEGQMSDYKGAALMLDALPRAKVLLGDKGYDADWFRTALAEKIAACIPSKANRKTPIHSISSQRRHESQHIGIAQQILDLSLKDAERFG